MRPRVWEPRVVPAKPVPPEIVWALPCGRCAQLADQAMRIAITMPDPDRQQWEIYAMELFSKGYDHPINKCGNPVQISVGNT